MYFCFIFVVMVSFFAQELPLLDMTSVRYEPNRLPSGYG